MDALIVEKTLLCRYDISGKGLSGGWLIYFDFKQQKLVLVDTYDPRWFRKRGVLVFGVETQTAYRVRCDTPSSIIRESLISQAQLDAYIKECLEWIYALYLDADADTAQLPDVKKLAISLSVVSYLHDIEYEIFDMNLYAYVYNAHRRIHRQALRVANQENVETCDSLASSTEEIERYPHYAGVHFAVKAPRIHAQQLSPKEYVLVWISGIFLDIYALSAA